MTSVSGVELHAILHMTCGGQHHRVAACRPPQRRREEAAAAAAAARGSVVALITLKTHSGSSCKEVTLRIAMVTPPVCSVRVDTPELQ